MSIDPESVDRHALYESCVQSAEETVPLLRAIHGDDPRVLGEDFSGTAAVSREWVRTVPDGTATAQDLDSETIDAGRAAARTELVDGDRLSWLVGDVRDGGAEADVVYVGNFSICELHARADLVAYLRATRARLKPGGVVVCDLYGGDTAYSIGSAERVEPGPEPGTHVLYTWEQREADPLTARVLNVIHFEIQDEDDATLVELVEAYVYDWRLWSVPELREAMLEAGFAETEVHGRRPDAIDDEGMAYVLAIEDPEDLDETWDVLVVGRADGEVD